MGAFGITICTLGLLAVLLVQKPLKERRWPARALSVLTVLVLIGGALLAFVALALGTPVDGAITLFFVVGFAGYLQLLADIITPRRTSRWFPRRGFLILFLLATWSWVSAISMYVHRGAVSDTQEACILVPEPTRYDTELISIWEMRLPEVATSRTGPTGTVILDYHAILVTPSDERTEVYNWSKKRMRFEILDTKLNRYLPTLCP
ncbi:hypothetical protein [Ruegeria arenilitoris]|uniref:hypothetical protein n=1 Tax=Ruegeria arenilitoris TaxID=1173585 RepID=UPI003C7CFA12